MASRFTSCFYVYPSSGCLGCTLSLSYLCLTLPWSLQFYMCSSSASSQKPILTIAGMLTAGRVGYTWVYLGILILHGKGLEYIDIPQYVVAFLVFIIHLQVCSQPFAHHP